LKRVACFTIFVLALAFSSASSAFPEVQARVKIIDASNLGSLVDPDLKEIHDQLGSIFSFTSYRLLKEVRVRLAGSRPVDIPIQPGRSMEVTLVGEYKNLIELRIRIKREGIPILNTSVRLSSGKIILIGGPRHGEDTIILAVSAYF